MTRRRPIVLGIESSCDDTACAVLDGEGRVLASTVSSQLAAHRPFGGVVPEIASREHLEAWPAVVGEAFAEAGVGFPDVDVVAATRGPGLLGSLLVGLSLGKGLAYGLGRPFYAVHHLEGHLFSPFLAPQEPARELPERFVGLVVSGGHTTLYAVAGGEIETVAETRDDAMGEAFDKVGKRLGLPFPQGPVVDELAEEGDPESVAMPVPRVGDELYFSYSGLKSAAVRRLEALERDAGDGGLEPSSPPVLDVLAAFRAAAVEQLVDRLERQLEARPTELVAVSGGVAANKLLRRRLTGWAAERGVELALVPMVYSGDNAAMIAFAALLARRRGEAGDELTAEAASRLPVR